MAGEWIKWTVGLAEKREVRLIASRCHRDRHEIAGRLMALWEWLDSNLSETDINPETGDAVIEMGEDWTSQIDDIAGLPGFAEALASPVTCWISARSGGRVTFPNLGRHNGKTAKMRSMEARKKSRQRGGKCPDDNGTPSGPEKRRVDIEDRERSAGAKFPNEADVVSHGATRVPPADREFCGWWWNANEGAGWVDKESRPIYPNRWKQAFNAAWSASVHNNQEKRAHSSPPPRHTPTRRDANI